MPRPPRIVIPVLPPIPLWLGVFAVVLVFLVIWPAMQTGLWSHHYQQHLVAQSWFNVGNIDSSQLSLASWLPALIGRGMPRSLIIPKAFQLVFALCSSVILLKFLWYRQQSGLNLASRRLPGVTWPIVILLMATLISPGVYAPYLSLNHHGFIGFLVLQLSVLIWFGRRQWQYRQQTFKRQGVAISLLLFGCGWTVAGLAEQWLIWPWLLVWMMLLVMEGDDNAPRFAPPAYTQLSWLTPLFIVGLVAWALWLLYLMLLSTCEAVQLQVLVESLSVSLEDALFAYQQPMNWLLLLWASAPLLILTVVLMLTARALLGGREPLPWLPVGQAVGLSVLALPLLSVSSWFAVLPWVWAAPSFTRRINTDTELPQGLSIVMDSFAVIVTLLSVVYVQFVLQGLGSIYPGSQWHWVGQPMWDPLPSLITLPLPVWKWWLLPYGLILFFGGLGVFAVNRLGRMAPTLASGFGLLCMLWIGCQWWVLPTFTRQPQALPKNTAIAASEQKLSQGQFAQVASLIHVNQPCISEASDGLTVAPAVVRLMTDRAYLFHPNRKDVEVLQAWPLWPVSDKQLPLATQYGLLPMLINIKDHKQPPPVMLLVKTPCS